MLDVDVAGCIIIYLKYRCFLNEHKIEFDSPGPHPEPLLFCPECHKIISIRLRLHDANFDSFSDGQLISNPYIYEIEHCQNLISLINFELRAL